jgi:hypothetical protein
MHRDGPSALAKRTKGCSNRDPFLSWLAQRLSRATHLTDRCLYRVSIGPRGNRRSASRA